MITTKIVKKNGEYRVKVWENGKRNSEADYFTISDSPSDKQDAIDTARAMEAREAIFLCYSGSGREVALLDSFDDAIRMMTGHKCVFFMNKVTGAKWGWSKETGCIEIVKD